MNTAMPARVVRTKAAMLAVLTTTALVLAACGGSTAAAPAASSAPAASADGGSADAGLAQAQAHVTEAETRPTQINITTPVSKPVPTGKKIMFISCGGANCALESNIIKSATDKLGWTLQTINTDGSPEQAKAAWTQAVTKKPDAVLYTATDRSIIDPQLRQLQKEGVFVSACCTVDPPENGISYVIGDATTNARVGEDMAAIAAVNNNGAGGTLYVNLPVFPILSAVKDAYVGALKKYCPSCAVQDLDLPLTAIGKDAPDKIVSAVRGKPDIKTIVLSVDAIGIGLPAALRAAGLTDKVLITGEGPVESTLAEIKAGQRGPTNVFPYYESMYSMVDAVVRHVVGDPVETRGEPSNWVVTKTTVPETDKMFWLVPDGQAQFFKLWGLG
jgi:ABC-type sugar transport system substrate-binding protein